MNVITASHPVPREKRRDEPCQRSWACLSPRVSQMESSAFMHLVFRFYEPPTSPSCKSLLLDLFGVDFLLLSVERVLPNTPWLLQALPAFGICPCSSSSLDCSLQKFHDSFPLLLQVGLEGHLLSEAPPGHSL